MTQGLSGSAPGSKAAATYNAAADHFDAPQLAFWSRHGAKAVELLAPGRGDRILDVGCGTGASAIPAAIAVGPTGQVLGLDIAEKMLDCARAKAGVDGLSNLRLDLRDMSAVGADLGSFDAVISVFSVFFVPDVEAQLGRLWRLVRPGGKMIVTVWGPGAFQPAASVFGEELGRLRPGIQPTVRPWERLVDPTALRETFAAAGVEAPALYPVSDQQPLSSPGDWWTIALGSGYRWEIEQLLPSQQQSLRNNVTARLRMMGVGAIETSAIHALARKPIRQ